MNNNVIGKKGVKNSMPSIASVGMFASVISALVAVLGLVWGFHSAQAPESTQVYVQGDENTVVLAQQCGEN